MIDILGLYTISGQAVLYRFLSLVFIVVVHGYALAYFSALLGDKGPKYDGRQTLNPITHLDMLGSFAMIFAGSGWIKPMNSDSQSWKYGKATSILAVVLSLIAVIALTWLCWNTRPLLVRYFAGGNLGFGIVGVLETITQAGIAFAVINLLPIPPLTGGVMLKAFAPGFYEKINKFSRYIGIAIFIIGITGVFSILTSPVYDWLRTWFIR